MRRVLICAVAALAMLGAPAEAQLAQTYRSAAPITPGIGVPSGDGVALACSAPGNMRLIMQDGSPFDVQAQQGTAIIDNIAVKDVNAAASTATCIVTVLRRS